MRTGNVYCCGVSPVQQKTISPLPYKTDIQISELRTQNSELRTQNSELRTQNSELRVK
ncbi:hypothetical protein GTR99_004364 [Salmonella enterica]|nr:hypothetical protein [Salmonella enterica]EEI1414309.1 hypothetical protein [Salmonella enterica]EEI4603217.1 hypothetical protein [Salmonella enterica]